MKNYGDLGLKYLKKLPYVKIRSTFQSWVAFDGGRQVNWWTGPRIEF